MGGYDKEDAAKDTNVSVREVPETWHQAREDAQKSGELPERAANKESQSSGDKSKSK